MRVRRKEKEGKRGEAEREASMLHMSKMSEFLSVPVQYQVWSKDELSRVVDGPPDEPDHQHLQPRALEEFHLIVKGQLHKT